MNKQVRATCEMQKLCLDDFRHIPNNFYPSGYQYSKEDRRRFKPITQRIMETLTKQLSENDYKNDAEWKDEAIILTNNNHDRYFFNKLSVKNFGKNNSKIIITWKKSITSTLSISVKIQIYDEKVNPMLFGYFFSGAKAIIT